MCFYVIKLCIYDASWDTFNCVTKSIEFSKQKY